MDQLIGQHQTKLEENEMELQTKDSELEALKRMSDVTITQLLSELSDAQHELEGTRLKWRQKFLVNGCRCNLRNTNGLWRRYNRPLMKQRRSFPQSALVMKRLSQKCSLSKRK
mmetsp:Transcript_24290/g.43920  ORF Transcript_24290/g.43920 Transcript_24290/m.43920 type:complete len:113 (-) Transcript_24290:745-1083(-)